ncbi:hypothetical protein ACOMHN_014874 [Nucella lapillus]
MAERDVVRITFKEIESIAETSKEGEQEEDGKGEDGSSKRRKKTKRPELAIYRPGQLRISKKGRDRGPHTQEGGCGTPQEEEDWDQEPERARGAYATTDEDSSRGGSKENSVDKDVGGGIGRDTSRYTPSPSSAASHREKGYGGGRRRSKRPDMRIYVPKARQQGSQRGPEEETSERDFGSEVNIDSHGLAEPEFDDLGGRLVSLSVREQERVSPSKAEQHTPDSQAPGGFSQSWSSAQCQDKAREEGRHTPPQPPQGGKGEKSDRRWRSERKKDADNDRDGTSQSERCGAAHHHGESRDSGHREQRRSGRGRSQTGDRTPAIKDRRSGRGKGQENREVGGAFRDNLPGRGRGRHRHQQYNRSSSNESLTKSVDLGHRSQWPSERMPQHGGTFPRSKAARNRNAAAAAGGKDAVGETVDSGQDQAGSKYAFSSMRAPRDQRSGSISSDTSGGSDLSWEDLEAEFEREKPDWNTQVEMYLEEMARQVQDSTQRLTDSIDNSFDVNPMAAPPDQSAEVNNPQPGLSRNLSASSDHIFTQEYRGRKKDRRRKGSRSKNSSRESSIHSNPHDDNLWPGEGKRSHHRRQRRRHSSAGPGGRVGTVEGQRAAESLRIMVGKNREKRQVMVEGKGKEGRRGDPGDGGGGGEGGPQRARHHSGSGYEHPRGKNYDPDRTREGRGGGGGEGGRGGGGRKSQEQQGQSQGQGHHGDERRRYGGEGPSRGRGHYHEGGGGGGRRNQRGQHQAQAHGGGETYYPRSAPSPGASSDNMPSPTSPHPHHTTTTAGLIKLPSEPPPSDRPHHPRLEHGQGCGGGGGQGHWQDRSQQQGHRQDSEQGYGREDRFQRASCSGPGPGERRLYDPKNPSKPIRVPETRPLQFLDPEESLSLSPHHHLSSSSPSSSSHLEAAYPPPSSPLSHSPGPAVGSPAGVGPVPPFPPFFPPHHPGYMYPPPPPPPPHMSMAFSPYGQGPPPPPHAPPSSHPMFYHGFQPPRPMGEPDEAYFSRETEQMVSGMSRPQCRMMAEQVLRDTAPLDCQLSNILSRGQLGEDAQRRIKQLRQELQRRYERVLLLDMDVANQRGVEQQLWRSVYYNVIEGLRRQAQDSTTTSAASVDGSSSLADTKAALNEILDEGTTFYESLLSKLQTTFNFNLEALLEKGGSGGTEGAGRGVRLAVLSAQRTMMFLGDIARYREQAAHSSNYGKARHWYMQAQKLAPKNGRPYNQLAILAVYTRRKLDAVYYYQRSLAASNPILTARESLMSLFDEVRRKEEAAEHKRLEEARRKRRRRTTSHTQPRVEVWIAPDGSRSRDQQSDRESDTDELSVLSSIELNKRFVQTFLNVHGKLFTKINFEVFVESSSLMLQEWRLLLQHSPSHLTAARLVQIAAICMFSIDNTVLKDESLEASCRSLLQEHAVEIALDLFGLLVARVNYLLLAHLAAATSDPDPKEREGRGRERGAVLPLDEDLRQMLPGVKVWVDWMMCHSSLWNPQPSLRPPDIGPQVDVWKNVAELCNTLKRVSTSHVTLHRHKQPGYETLVLMEDSMLAGFVPLLSAPVDTVYVSTEVDKEVSMDCLRLEKLALFGEYLCGIEPPMLAFDVERGRYFSVAPAPVKSEERLVVPVGEQGTELSEDVIVESEESGEDGDETPGETIKELKARKAELRQRVEDQARNKHNLQSLVEQNSGSRLELEVRPRFLVTDTNCFIDHLPSLRSLVAMATYTLVVPLVVVNELDGLAKGASQGKGHYRDHSPEHVAMVTRHASQALTYLEAEVKAKNSHVRVQTSKGSVLETLAFRSEELDSSGNNDDLILSCCLHYCKDMARDFMPRDKDSPVRLFRDMVLLTDDRNLRLKAHTSNVPVKDVPAFCRWSKAT